MAHQDEPPGRQVGAWEPLRFRRFRRLWLATMVSHLGTYLQLTVGPWLMLEMTGSPLMVGLITTALFLPRLLWTVPAGLLSDLLDRRLVLAIGFVICSIASIGLALAVHQGRLTPGLLLGLTFLLGTGSAVGKPAHQTFLPDLVAPRLRAQAITLNSASHQVARIVGPSIGGGFVAFGAADLAFLLNGASFLVVLLALLLTPSQDVGRRSTERGTHDLGGMLAGFRYVRENPAIRHLLVLTAVFVVWAIAVQALLPNVVADQLDLGPTAYGILYGIFGVGAVIGAATRERVGSRLHDTVVARSMVTFGCGTLLLAISQEAVLAAVALMMIGASWVWTMTTLNATVQLGAPAWVRGRVIALFVLAVATKPIGSALAGALAEGVNVPIAIAVSGLGTVATGLVAIRFPPGSVRPAKEPSELGQ